MPVEAIILERKPIEVQIGGPYKEPEEQLPTAEGVRF